ncbi:hypothetical protein HGM15179_015960, partial [Zosterops borbonicus]
ADFGGGDTPSTTGMESLGKVIRLLTLGVIDHPVDILHSECWGRCTNALAKDVIMSDTSKCLKSLGRVMQTLEKALEEQETWKAAQQCLGIIPKLGVGATTQTTLSDSFINSELLFKINNPLQSQSSPLALAPDPRNHLHGLQDS